MIIKQNTGRFSGRYWSQTSNDDPLILSKFERLQFKQYVRLSKRNWIDSQQMLLAYCLDKAVILWKRKPFQPGKSGVRCSIFVNNSEKLSSELLRDAVDVARLFWLESTFFVHLNPRFFPENAEKTFKECGWEYHGESREGYPIYFYD